MKKNQKHLLTLAILMAASPLYAASISEIEDNHPINSAHYLNDASGKVQINAAIGTVGATETVSMKGKTFTKLASTDDVDFYSFFAKAGDVITIDIDNGVGGQQSVDTILGLFDNDKKLLRMNDNAATLDSGSVSTSDSRIDNFVVPASGVYTVGVSNYPRFFQDGGSVDAVQVTGGDYTLNIEGVSPAVQQISIEVKPGSGERAPLNPKSKGKIPVALLSSSNFNAMDIKPSTLTFGATGAESSLSKCSSAGQDVNGDGLLDLVCHFENQLAGFKAGDLEGVLRGSTRSGMAVEGRGLLKVIPGKTK